MNLWRAIQHQTNTGPSTSQPGNALAGEVWSFVRFLVAVTVVGPAG